MRDPSHEEEPRQPYRASTTSSIGSAAYEGQSEAEGVWSHQTHSFFVYPSPPNVQLGYVVHQDSQGASLEVGLWQQQPARASEAGQPPRPTHSHATSKSQGERGKQGA